MVVVSYNEYFRKWGHICDPFLGPFNGRFCRLDVLPASRYGWQSLRRLRRSKPWPICLAFRFLLPCLLPFRIRADRRLSTRFSLALFSSFWGCFVLHIEDVCRSVFLQGFATFYPSDQNPHCIHRGHVERESKLIVYLPDFLASTLPASASVSQLECMPQDFDCFVCVHFVSLSALCATYT